MDLLVVEAEQHSVERLPFFNEFLETVHGLHLHMFLFLPISHTNHRPSLSNLRPSQGIQRELLLLAEGNVPFHSKTIHREIPLDVELCHDLLPQSEDGVIPRQHDGLLLRVHLHGDIDGALV